MWKQKQSARGKEINKKQKRNEMDRDNGRKGEKMLFIFN
jgi:hypothetical protein